MYWYVCDKKELNEKALTQNQSATQLNGRSKPPSQFSIPMRENI
jgi:hypothetical protein